MLDLRRGKGMVLDEADHDTWSAGSFFTNPVVAPAVADEVARRVAAADQRPVTAWPTADGRVKLSAAALIERAGVPRGHPGPDAGGPGLHPPHARPDQPRRRDDGASCWPSPATCATASRRPFGVRLVPEPVLVGCALD